MIISVNPFKQLDIYDQKDVQEYLGPGHEESPPHVFAGLRSSPFMSLFF